MVNICNHCIKNRALEGHPFIKKKRKQEKKKLQISNRSHSFTYPNEFTKKGWRKLL